MPPRTLRHVICRFWARTDGPAQPLDKHDRAIRPSPNLMTASECGTSTGHRQSASDVTQYHDGDRRPVGGAGRDKERGTVRRHAEQYDDVAPYAGMYGPRPGIGALQWRRMGGRPPRCTGQADNPRQLLPTIASSKLAAK